MTAREAVFPSVGRRSRAQSLFTGHQINGFLFVSGQVGSREDGSPEPELKSAGQAGIQ